MNFIDFFEEVETREEYNGYFCSIAEAISIVVLGSLCGFKNVSQIHQWAASERVKEFLKEKFQIRHIPCYYWLLVLLKMVKTDTLSKCLTKWAEQFMPKDRSSTTISMDGKTIRSTTGMKNMSDPLHIISAQVCELGITLASETVDAKSNEIPAVQELLKKMDIEGCLIVADALNCQQKTAELIIAGKGDYLLDAKGNQRAWKQKSPNMSMMIFFGTAWTLRKHRKRTVTVLKLELHIRPATFHGCTAKKSGKAFVV